MIDDLAHPGAARRRSGASRPSTATALVDVLLGLSARPRPTPTIVSADLNPLIVVDGRPVAVDALVEVASGR